MPADRIATLTRIYEAWAKGEFSTGEELFDEQTTLAIDSEVPGGSAFTGRKQRRAYMTAYLRDWKSVTISAESFEQAGDRVLVKVRQAGIARDTGLPIGIDYFQVWTFRGDSVLRLESILRESRARKVAGLADRGSG